MCMTTASNNISSRKALFKRCCYRRSAQFALYHMRSAARRQGTGSALPSSSVAASTAASCSTLPPTCLNHVINLLLWQVLPRDCVHAPLHHLPVLFVYARPQLTELPHEVLQLLLETCSSTAGSRGGSN